jgi:hypothetical protein
VSTVHAGPVVRDDDRSAEGAEMTAEKAFERERQFIRLPFSTVDSGALAAVSPAALQVLLVLWRHVWRSHEKGHPHVRLLFQWGWTITFITQRKIGRLVGVQRQRVNVLIRQLVHLGWIFILPVGHRRPNIYVLGEEEALFFEEWLAEVRRRQQEAADNAERTPEQRAKIRQKILARFTGETEATIKNLLAVSLKRPFMSQKGDTLTSSMSDTKTSSVADTRIEKHSQLAKRTTKREGSPEEVVVNAARTTFPSLFSPRLASLYADRALIERPRPLDREEAIRRYKLSSPQFQSRKEVGGVTIGALIGFLILKKERKTETRWKLGPVKFERIKSTIVDARRAIGNRGLVSAIEEAVKRKPEAPQLLLADEAFLLKFDVTERLRNRRRIEHAARRRVPARSSGTVDPAEFLGT